MSDKVFSYQQFAARFDTGQLLAVTHKNGPMMVLAGPGSGKTRVITGRVEYLTQQCGVSPSSILVLTFTRAAARSMQFRYTSEAGRTRTDVTFGTFHSVFYSYLRKDPVYSEFQLIDSKNAFSLMADLLRRRFPDSCFDNMIPELLGEVSRIKNGRSAEDPLIKRICAAYVSEMHDRKLMDFDDMLLLFLSLLTENSRVLSELQTKYQYILIDEFQDTNRIQYQILKKLCGNGNLFVVGDDDQSIYGFRGADPSCMFRFPGDFPDTRLVQLRYNYRTERGIMKAAIRLIRHNRHRFRKKVKAVKHHGICPVIRGFETEREEAGYIEHIIASLSDNHEQSPKIAVLSRTHERLEKTAALLPEGIRNKVCFLTFHGSKGLEFDHVFLVGTNRGITPHPRAVGKEETEEERRLFYVAMTRAERSLHILYTKKTYNKITEKSVFIDEIKRLF